MKPDLRSCFPIWEHLTTVLPGGEVSARSRRTVFESASSQGVSYLEKQLPKLGKAIYQSFETGSLPIVEGFSYCYGRPRLFRELFSRVYKINGELRQNPLSRAQIATAKKILQLTLCFYKVERPAASAVEDEVVADFAKVQQYNSNIEQSWDEADRQFLNRAKRLVCRVLSNTDFRDIVPRHGPGAVFGGARPHEKWRPFLHYPRIHEVWPDEEYQYASLSHLCDDGVNNRARVGDPIVRIVTVPKNADTVRMIAVEERYPQFIKLGIMDKIYQVVERHPLTRGYVNFSDQTINHVYAECGSIDRSYATIDLTAASDTVSNALVKRLLPARLFRDFDRLRAVKARWKGVDIPLHSYATMGSALCFPIEAIVFWALVAECIGSAKVVVYGDDIIVPNHMYDKVVECLHVFGMRVNLGKSYHAGFFRESCGQDFYHGYNISIVKWRKPVDLINCSITIRDACSAFLNEIKECWGVAVSNSLFHCMVKTVGPLPHSRYAFNKGVAYITDEEWSLNDVVMKVRWNSSYQRKEYRIEIFRPRQRKVPDTWYEIFRSLTGHGSLTRSSSYDDPKRMTRAWSWVEL